MYVFPCKIYMSEVRIMYYTYIIILHEHYADWFKKI